MLRTPHHVSARKVPFLLLLCGWFVWGVPTAQADEVPYRHFTTFDGLPHESITALAQTPDGLLWVGTQEGLAIYDGEEFWTIPLPDSIPPFPVSSIYPRPDGSVWVGLPSGTALKVSSRGVERVIDLRQRPPSRILVRGNTVLFVTTRAVWRLPPGGDQPTRQPLRYEMRPPSQTAGAPAHVGVGAWDAALGPDGTLWILDGRRGPGRFHPDGSVAFAGEATVEQDRLWNEIRFTEDGDGFIVQGGRLHRFRPATQSLDVVTDTLDRSGTRLDLQSGTVYLHQRRRVLRYDVATGQMREPLGPNVGLPDVSPSCVLRGADGALWVGTERGLVHLMAPEVRHVEAIEGRSLQWVTRFLHQDEHLWVASWGEGLLQLRPKRKRVTPGGHTKWVPLRARDGFLHALPATSKETWYRWRPSVGWHRWGTAPKAVRGFVDSSGTGVFWHGNGVYRHSPALEEPTQLASWPSSERGHYILALAPNGDPILRARGHLLRLHPTDETVKDTLATFPEHARARGPHMVADPAGRVWGAFESGGLLRVDPEENEPRLLLQNQSVRNVRAVGDSLVLASTQEGVYLVDAARGTVRRHLTQADGLLSSTATGAYLTADTLYVSHPNGLTLVPTRKVFRESSSPPALLTALEVNLEDRSLQADSILAASDRTIGFSYTAPELRYPGRVRYEIRLRPQDTEWQTTGRDFARYTDLDPGTYRFEVRARLGDQPPGPAATYSFTIPPFFYETWWFQLLVGLGLIGLGVGVYRWRTYRLRRRQEELEAAVQSRTEELAEEKKKTEKQAERLQELDEAKNRFFAHISHEFRTPLSLILTPLEEAVRNTAADSVSFGTEQVRRMVRNARRLQRLIEQLLDLATLEAGRMELDRKPGDLARFVRRTVEAFTSMAEQNGIDLRVHTDDSSMKTRFDPEKVESIVHNLLSNALKYTPEGGQVTVWVGKRTTPSVSGEESPRAVLIKVADTGPGMDAETQERIFERFEQAKGTTGEREGAGLGLALTKELVELHGGTIHVESTPGEGTTFTVSLPIVPVAEAERTDGELVSAEDLGRRGLTTPAPHRPGALDKAVAEETGDGAPSGDDPESRRDTVLVVEDNDEMRSYLREQLSDRWRVLAAADGEEGWQAVREEAPDLVLSDVMMPGLSGFELCEKMKQDPDLRSIPVILLTARSESEAAAQGLDCGADDYVAKPFDLNELKKRIVNHLAAREHLRDQYREEVRLDALDRVVDTEDVSFLETVTETVEAHLGDPNFSVDRLAEAAALSRRQFTRRMKEATGKTPAAFIRERRIERAKTLLEEEPETIAEVAYAVGFRAPSSFSKTFREQVGASPSEYVERQAG